MAYVMEHYNPAPVRSGPHTFQGFQTWYRGVETAAAEGAQAEFNIPDHLIPLVHGCHLFLGYEELTGNALALVVTIQCFTMDMTNNRIHAAGTTIVTGTAHPGGAPFDRDYFPYDATAHLGPTATHCRPHIGTVSTGSSTCDILLAQVPAENSGR